MRAEILDLSLFFLAIAKTSLLTGLAPAVFLAVIVEAKYPYVYRWSRYLGMAILEAKRKGERCRVLVRGKRNSCLIEFPDGAQAVTSRNALKKAL